LETKKYNAKKLSGNSEKSRDMMSQQGTKGKSEKSRDTMSQLGKTQQQ